LDLALWDQIESSGKLAPEEYFAPERMSGRLVQAQGITRQETGRVMRVSRSRNGRSIFHPNGDACPFPQPDEQPTHGGFSLHYFGIDHDLSKRSNEPIESPTEDGLAQDFDFAVADPNFLFELYLKLVWIRFPLRHIDGRGLARIRIGGSAASPTQDST